jgi:hypothetical protein
LAILSTAIGPKANVLATNEADGPMAANEEDGPMATCETQSAINANQ